MEEVALKFLRKHARTQVTQAQRMHRAPFSKIAPQPHSITACWVL
jgi:hypothetical protein